MCCRQVPTFSTKTPAFATPLFCLWLLAAGLLLAAPSASSGMGAVGPVTAGGVLAQSSRQPLRRLQPSSPGTAGPTAEPEGTSEAPGESSEPAETSGTEPAPNGEGFAGSLVRFIRAYATWIVVALGGLFVGILIWTYTGARRGYRGTGDDIDGLGFHEGDAATSRQSGKHQRYSSTKIQKSDISSRLEGSVTETEVETDREYALVVDEEALKLPPVPEDSEIKDSRPTGDPDKIRSLLKANQFLEAYAEYATQITSNGKLKFPGEVDCALADGLIRAREYEKAKRVLERHVATHRGMDVQPEAYFNLGYIHFMNKTLQKSRRFFRLFVKAEKNPEYVARARKILEKIESTGLKS